MKKFFCVLTICTFATISLVACNDDDDNNEKVIPLTEVSEKIKSYVGTHFPAHSIVKAVKDTSLNTHKIYLLGNVELKFTSSDEVYDIEAKTKLPDSVIPVKLLQYVTKNYPSNHIISWEKKLYEQEIELNNDVDLIFSLTGDFLRVD